MNKPYATPAEFQIAGTRDLGLTIGHDFYTGKPMHVVHEVSVARGTDSVRESLQRAGYNMQRGYMQDGAQYFVWSKVYGTVTPVGIAAIKADCQEREIIIPCRHGLMVECAACIAETEPEYPCIDCGLVEATDDWTERCAPCRQKYEDNREPPEPDYNSPTARERQLADYREKYR
jgi:hypothetical protein